jgi:hypothetical protein
MGAIATGFNTVFADGANVSLASARGLGSTIETYLSAPYTLNYNAAASPTSAPSGYIQRLVGKDADAYQMLVIDGFGGIPTTRLRRANGTGAVPTAVVSSDVTGRFEFSGYYTSGGAAYATNPASVRGEATENWSSTAQGSRVVIATTPNTTATPADALYVGQDQSVLAKGNLGYITGQGAGGTVFSGAGSSAGQTFTLTNNKIKATSLLLINVAGAPTGLYYFGVKIGAGSATITVFNPGNNNEQPVLSFIVLDGATN